MKFTRYIAALAVSLISVACSLNELDEPVDIGRNDGSSVNVHARISNYYDYDVDTRSAKSPEEAVVSSMALAVFPIENDAIQPCVDYYFEEGQKVTFTIDRTNTIYDNAANKPFAMYIFANMSNMPKTLAEVKAANNGGGMTVEDFVKLAHTVQKSYYGNADYPGLPDTGFPMMGSLGDNVSKDGDTMLADGKVLILKPTVSNENPHSLPLVDSKPTDLLNIPMKAMYAKFSFDITVNPTQTIEGNTQSFTLTSYTLHNIPRTVDFDMTSNHDEDVIADEDVNNDEITIYDNSVTVEGGGGEGAIQFSFYIPERYLEPTISAAEYDYPFMEDGEIRDEDMNLRQRYKPDLIGDDKKATYVTINGKYLDHNARTWDVSYNIYLGADNYGDFNIIRNSHYSNNIAIRGITNSDDMSNEDGAISIDHRVNITRSLPIIESLRRETLLDSHFEVRPLRIRAVAGEPEVTVTIKPNDGTNNTPDWIRLEHKNNGDLKNGNDDYLPNGKRKYFTYGLITGKAYDGSTEPNNLSDEANTTVTFTANESTSDCIWIYVDECTTETYSFNDDGSVDVKPRSAKIVVTVEGEEDNPSEYIINQSKLYPVTITGEDMVVTVNDDGSWTSSLESNQTRNYLIESYEEYLYDFDAEELHSSNLTDFDGMQWGLDGLQLSNKYKSLDITHFDNYNRLSSSNITTLEQRVTSYYDFYIARHDYDINPPHAPSWGVGVGQTFCDDIIATANQHSDDKYHIGALLLNEKPKSAVEYCYNKNKRNKDGSVASSDWYLPAIHEMEDIMVGAYDAFDGVFQAQDYWSSQPSYHYCYFFMSQSFGILIWAYTVAGWADYYMDNINYARSTKATYGYDEETGNYKYSYNPSGVDIPAEYQEERTVQKENGQNVTENFFVRGGYYRWDANRGGTYTSSATNDNYAYGNAYIDSHPVYPELGEKQENGSRPRTEENRVRCVYKKK
ncbi:MAG: DUF4906 domain-containing protein [Bacteroidales bacterium]|nr:DUF4906 domain-containing protein [Bacteroidales bacterium]